MKYSKAEQRLLTHYNCWSLAMNQPSSRAAYNACMIAAFAYHPDPDEQERKYQRALRKVYFALDDIENGIYRNTPEFDKLITDEIGEL